MHVPAHDVDEEQYGALGIPHRPLAEFGVNVEDELEVSHVQSA